MVRVCCALAMVFCVLGAPVGAEEGGCLRDQQKDERSK